MPNAITFQHYEVLVRDDGAPWELGRGAMGVTYKALDTNLRVPVALKVIHPRQLDSELVAQRFIREARAAARLRHPHIAAVYHLGQEGENWFYAMEFVAGDTAEGLVKREGPLPEAVVVTLAIQAARALNAAAALELVHRDIKPSNLMLTREGDEWQLKLIDFGLARTFTGTGSEADEDLAAVTHSGFVGTPYYASPEQLEQKELDIRSDIYSLGVTLWFLLTGKVPFTGSVVSVLSQHLHKAPPFEQLAGCASPPLRGLIERMLAKEPAARPQSALDLRRELEQCLGAPAPASVTSVPAAPRESVAAADETAETMVAPASAASTGPIFTPGESHFDAADTVAEFGFGQLCRARERTSGESFAILRLGPLRGLEDAASSALRQTVERARPVEHPQVWRVHALEEDAAETRIVMAWSDGYSWRDLLRRRRELPPEEAFRLLALAASGIDAILAAGIEQPDVSLAGLWCEAPAPDALPTGVKVSPLGILRTFSLDATWIGEGTIAGTGATDVESGATGAIRALGQVAYETLGGNVNAPGFPPLPALGEGANNILRTALRDPVQFVSATALIEQLAREQAEPAPVTFRAAATVTRPARESVANPKPEPPIVPILSEPAAELAASAAPRATPNEEPLAPPPPAPSFELPTRPRSRGPLLAASVAVLAGVAWFIFGHNDPQPDPHATDPAASVPLPPPEPTTATPEPQPLSVTPAPIVIVKPPTPTPAPTPPPPTREQLARMMQTKAGNLRTDRKWKESAQALLQMRASYPEYSSAADIDLELLFRDIRWRYTRHREQPPELRHDAVEALLPELEQADRAGIVGAQMLLGQHHSRKDWQKAIAYYEKARDRAPKATTRIGLLYAERSTDPAELAKAWRYFQAAKEAGDLDGKFAVGEALLYGNFRHGTRNKIVPGLEMDQPGGVRILQEIIATAPGSREPPELANAQLVETYISEPTRSKLALATFYFDQEQSPSQQQAWYREEKARIDHGQELRRLLEEAKEDWHDAYALLGAAASNGFGSKPDRAAAEAYFQQGIAKGNTTSMFFYAELLRNRSGPGPIPTEARKHYVMAAEKGDPAAIEFCKAQGIPFKRPAP
jgi:TPR repeat protein/tRNA A-37 threonylcarbamoyl transferase component Bud32